MIAIKRNGKKAWVTFTFTPTYSVDSVAISGEWNEWNEEPMKQKKSGDYYITKVFSIGDRFQFGYRVNDSDWRTEEECESVPSPFFSENSLLTLFTD